MKCVVGLGAGNSYFFTLEKRVVGLTAANNYYFNIREEKYNRKQFQQLNISYAELKKEDKRKPYCD